MKKLFLLLALLIASPCWAAIGFRSVSTVSGIQNTSITGNLPAGHTTNDVLIASLVTGDASTGGSPTISTPAGWTLIKRQDAPGPATCAYTASTDCYTTVSVWSRVDNGSVSAPAWTFDKVELADVRIAAYTGVNTTTPVDTSGGIDSGISNVTTVTLPQLTAALGGGTAGTYLGTIDVASTLIGVDLLLTPAAGGVEWVIAILGFYNSSSTYTSNAGSPTLGQRWLDGSDVWMGNQGGDAQVSPTPASTPSATPTPAPGPTAFYNETVQFIDSSGNVIEGESDGSPAQPNHVFRLVDQAGNIVP